MEPSPPLVAEHIAWLKGKKGAGVHAVSPDSGDMLATANLASPPVFDGMVGGGRPCLSTMEHKLTWLGP